MIFFKYLKTNALRILSFKIAAQQHYQRQIQLTTTILQIFDYIIKK